MVRRVGRGSSAGEIEGVGVTWSTFVDLGKPAGLKVFPNERVGADDVYVCASYSFGDALIVPDNVVGTCSNCGKPVQMRPHAPKAPKRVCTPCAIVAGYLPSPG